MSVFYIGSLQGFYGTAYGVMVGAKIAMFLALLALGLGNLARHRTAAQESGNVGDSPAPLRRSGDRHRLHDLLRRRIADIRSAGRRPHDRSRHAARDRRAQRTGVAAIHVARSRQLAISQMQAQLDIEAEQRHAAAAQANVPGSGILPPRNAQDIAWSEYNHHWAGIFVLLIGLLALLNRAGVGWLKHWPLLFLLMAGFLLVRSDPEVWPLGP
jgi:putative copper resistance protein D